MKRQSNNKPHVTPKSLRLTAHQLRERRKAEIQHIFGTLLVLGGTVLLSLLIAHSIASPSSGTIKVTPASESVQSTPQVDPATGEWSYHFSAVQDGPLDRSDWNFEEGTNVSNYNKEAQAYTSRTQNVRIENGALVIEAMPEAIYGKQYSSARINTHHKFSMLYGTIEVEVKIPRGVGTWPAVWMMPRDNVYGAADYGISPNDPHAWAMNGEIDFVEAIGAIPGENIPAAHNYNQLKRGTIYTPAHVSNPYDTYHRYGLIKTPDKLTFTLDGVPYATRERTSVDPRDWPYNQPYYLILNLAIGGNWAGKKGIDDSSAPWKMQVKSITYKPL